MTDEELKAVTSDAKPVISIPLAQITIGVRHRLTWVISMDLRRTSRKSDWCTRSWCARMAP